MSHGRNDIDRLEAQIRNLNIGIYLLLAAIGLTITGIGLVAQDPTTAVILGAGGYTLALAGFLKAFAMQGNRWALRIGRKLPNWKNPLPLKSEVMDGIHETEVKQRE